MRACLARGPTPVREYYAHPAVAARIREYSGDAVGGGGLSCLSIAALTADEGPRYRWELAPMLPPSALDNVLAAGADFARSLWDRRDILLFIDLDYHNQDYPGEVFAHPLETFATLEPTYRATRVLLRRFGIRALTTVSGRGYHFVGRIDCESPAAGALATLCREPPEWWSSYPERRLPWMPLQMPEHDARIYAGLGMVAEYLGHLIERRASRSSHIPVVLNGTAVGSERFGRESVSIDLSHFGDPLDQRHVRSAFGTYQLHLQRPDIFGPMARRLGVLITVPRTDMPLLELIEKGRTPDSAIAQAKRETAFIPDASDGVSALLTQYAASPLAAFHARYQGDLSVRSAEPAPRVDHARLPPCVAEPLAWPNDLLLRPEYLQHVTRYLLAVGWTAGRVAALVSTLYAADDIWGSHWQRAHPRARAEFDVRVFAGLHAAGTDGALDFNCRSAQEKGICPRGPCPYDLRRERAMLLERAAVI